MSNNESDNPQDRPPSFFPGFPPPAAPSSSIPASVREDKKSGWERDVLEKLALFAVKEQRARRRWGIFFRIAILVVIVLGGWMAFTYNKIESEPLGTHTALVEIAAPSNPKARVRPAWSFRRWIKPLRPATRWA
jgi:protease-4